jgi:branched-chain amino acid transport system substrate-binding protein
VAKRTQVNVNRRKLIGYGMTMAAAAAVGVSPWRPAHAASKIKIGLMLPSTGTFAQLGLATANGFKLALLQEGEKIGGREIEYYTVDDASDPAKAADNASRLVHRDKVDVLIGTIHSGVQMGMIKIAKESGVLHIIPNAGLNAATGPLCAPNVFRASFANSQTSYPMGRVMAERGFKNVVTIAWKYAAGDEMVEGFKASFTQAGGRITRELSLPFPNVEFQPLITQIASLKPDAVFAFFAGGGAVKFLKDWQASGLKDRIPLYGQGALTEGILEAAGSAAEGIETTLHYGDGIDTPTNSRFRALYEKTFKAPADLYAMQGWDTALLLLAGLEPVGGDVTKKKEIIAVMRRAEIDSPRGKWTLSKGHNPIQDIYLRRVTAGQNKVIGVAMKAVDYPPASLCKAET